MSTDVPMGPFPVRFVIEARDFARVFEALRARNYQIIGPTVRDGAIIYDELRSADDLPVGWTDEQAPGRYRLHRRNDAAWFGYAVGPHSWKKYVHPPALRLWRAERTEEGFCVITEEDEPPLRAFLGVRACELQALAVQDRVFLHGPFVDTAYKARRDRLFLVAVHCGAPSGSCFCVSMGTGPRASGGFDWAVTEVLFDDRHFFVGEVGTERGREILGEVAWRAATLEEQELAERVTREAAARMGRQMETHGIQQLLYQCWEHPRWDDVATRCIACANCTMVCPTCFCTNVEDTTDLTGDHAERWRKWDSCFTAAFSYVHGGSVRNSIRARYRQWLTHKLATWIDQFGVSGCVGCGRCITWCPVGIDITEEVRALRSGHVDKAAPLNSRAGDAET